MNTQTKRLTITALLCAMAYISVYSLRIPVIAFLKYEPKDIVIAIGGFLYGPLTALLISVTVSLLEMLTISDTDVIGAAMNIISSCAFACTAAAVYAKKRNIVGAAMGVIAGWILCTAVMMLWNYLVAPVYMKVPRQIVVSMLPTVFLPFNLIKGGINAAAAVLLYKPLFTALKKANLLPSPADKTGASARRGATIAVMITALFVIATLIMLILVFRGII